MTSWGTDERLALDTALREFDHGRVRELARAFAASVRAAADPPAARDALEVVRKLQRKRYTDQVHHVVEAVLAAGCDTVDLRHRYALALLDADLVAAGEALLQQLPPDVRSGDTEVAGAVGRVHKQRYVTAAVAGGRQRTEDLEAAVDVYGAVHRSDPDAHYHGINAASLLVRASRDGRSLRGHPDPVGEARRTARQILEALDARSELGTWEHATAAEAALVLDDPDRAVRELVGYVGSDADAFEFASTLRQFTLVWQLDERTEPGARLLPLLQARLLQAEGGALRVAPGGATVQATERLDDVRQGLERVFGSTRFRSLGWLRNALTACRSVARIEDGQGNGVGTGFVVDGEALRPGQWPRAVVLTNAHVVPDELRPADALLSFRGGDRSDPVPAGEVLWQSGREALDACFLAPPAGALDGIDPLRVRRTFPALGDDHSVRAYVVGHPGEAQQVQLSLHDSLVLHADDVHVHYRTATEGGSSGSPVFDDRWQVIALHHGWTARVPGAAGEQGPANEGIRFDRIAEEVRGAG